MDVTLRHVFPGWGTCDLCQTEDRGRRIAVSHPVRGPRHPSRITLVCFGCLRLVAGFGHAPESVDRCVACGQIAPGVRLVHGWRTSAICWDCRGKLLAQLAPERLRALVSA